MMAPADRRPTRTSRDENFPVASILIHPDHRKTILAFYRFARAADDAADDPALPPAEKLARLEALERTLLGGSDSAADAIPLRQALAMRGLSAHHALDLLAAFRMDVIKQRYRDWDELMGYCALSAMPVGRFVLDVHGESRATWPASDALCAALQVINHLQDCGADYRRLDRVYIPLDVLERNGVGTAALGAERASPRLLTCIRELAARTSVLLKESEPLTAQVADLRLGLEVSVIRRLATRLIDILMHKDPLSERVHLTGGHAAVHGAGAVAGEIGRRLVRRVSNLSGRTQKA